MVKKRIPKKITSVINNYILRLTDSEKIPIKKVIVFGSQVKGTKRKWSDIDVCLISSAFVNPMETMQFLLAKREKEEVLAGLEPIGFTPKDFKEGGSLIEEIKKTGVELK